MRIYCFLCFWPFLEDNNLILSHPEILKGLKRRLLHHDEVLTLKICHDIWKAEKTFVSNCTSAQTFVLQTLLQHRQQSHHSLTTASFFSHDRQTEQLVLTTLFDEKWTEVSLQQAILQWYFSMESVTRNSLCGFHVHAGVTPQRWEKKEEKGGSALWAASCT